MQHKLIDIVESTWFTHFVIIIIILNAITLGLETAPDLVGEWMPILLLLDTIFLTIFTVDYVQIAGCIGISKNQTFALLVFIILLIFITVRCFFKKPQSAKDKNNE